MKRDTGIRVIVVEVQKDLRERLVVDLNQEGLETTGVGSGLHFYQALAESCYSIAVLDADLLDQNPCILAEYIKKNSCMGVIMLSVRSSVADRIRGFRSGVDMYLAKPIDSEELAAAILRLAKRDGNNGCAAAKPPAPNSWQLLRKTWQLITPGGHSISLTAKEMLFLACVAEATGKAVKRDTLLAALGYRDDEYANRAMDSLLRRLRRKVEEYFPHPSPIKTIRTQGYCFTASIIII
jgi:two-component system, OmpR family, response regulator